MPTGQVVSELEQTSEKEKRSEAFMKKLKVKKEAPEKSPSKPEQQKSKKSEVQEKSLELSEAQSKTQKKSEKNLKPKQELILKSHVDELGTHMELT